MYHNDINTGNFELQRMKEPSVGYVRVLHAVPDAPNVDVYANDKIIAKNLAFGKTTPYTPVSEGNYEISLYVAGTKGSPVLANCLAIGNNTILTVAAVGTLKTIGFLSIPDSNMTIESGKAMVRFSHLSPNAPAVDITLPNGTILFSNVSFKQLTPYISVPPMNYTLQVRAAGTPNVVLTVPNVNLEQNKMYTVYAVGLIGQNPKLEALLLLDKGVAPSAPSVIYSNTQYGFKFTLPKSWENYSILTDKWEGRTMTGIGNPVVEAGPIIIIRHPQWTSQRPRQDIPIMIFTLAQWNKLQNGELSVGAAPILPSELGRNSKYIFALPARYNYAFPEGFEEVESILAKKPLEPI